MRNQQSSLFHLASLACLYLASITDIGFSSSNLNYPHQEPEVSSELPIPEDLRDPIQQAIILGRAIYFQDTASAIATDVLLEELGSLDGKGIGGYITLPEKSDQNRPPAWWTFFFSVGEQPHFLYRIRVPTANSREAEHFEISPPRPVPESTLNLIRARQTALNAAQPFEQPINPVLLPGSLIHQDGVLVYLLAGTSKPNTAVLGKHYRVLVSEDGQTVKELLPLTKSIMEQSTVCEDGMECVALGMTHIVTDYPLETHVFLSMRHGLPVHVITNRGLWRVDGDTIALIESDIYEAPK